MRVFSLIFQTMVSIIVSFLFGNSTILNGEKKCNFVETIDEASPEQQLIELPLYSLVLNHYYVTQHHGYCWTLAGECSVFIETA
jgi:hypothetical protein